jgi:hypothetical protein
MAKSKAFVITYGPSASTTPAEKAQTQPSTARLSNEGDDLNSLMHVMISPTQSLAHSPVHSLHSQKKLQVLIWWNDLPIFEGSTISLHLSRPEALAIAKLLLPR